MSTTSPAKPRAGRKQQAAKEVSIEPHDLLKTESAPAQPAVAQEVVPTKRPRKPAGPPTEKQMAARAQFREKVAQAQALRAAEPGLKYNEAIKRVYGK